MSIVDDFAAIGARLNEIEHKQPSPDDDCPVCFNGGWECYSTGFNDPHFQECTRCHNPKGFPPP
ncbi:hypothetical protein [Bradyrhizobium sp. Ai1a-2]|uniref:hypothetical protein n=1 Tax=Bradyrhizobium sp. Ai1a-2 TaxID=196490 RepID=UPI000405B242|nr:hypothetical protein [Bradyrhizobium sp. Ai1a-2]